MSTVNEDFSAYQYEDNSHYETSQLNFDDQVLQFIRDNKPEGTLTELINKIKSLDPDNTYSLQQLNKALLYTDATLRLDPSYEAYTKDTLDKNTTQLLGVNMLFNNMMNSIFFPSDDKDEDSL